MSIQIYPKLLKVILPLVLICCSFRATAQEDSIRLRKTPKPFLNKFFNRAKYDPRYIEDYTWNWNMRLTMLVKNNDFQFRRSRYRPSATYAINESVHVGAFGNYQWIGLGVFVKLPETTADINKKGNTQGYDTYLNAYGRKMGFDANFQQYWGFYLREIKNADTNVAAGGWYPQRGDIMTQSLMANMHIVLNHNKFSFRSIFNQTEIQKKSAGSVIINPFFSFYRIRSDSALMPGGYRDIYPPELELSEGRFYSLGLSVGYAYTLVYKRFFAAACIFPGIAVQIQDYTTLTERYNNRIAAGTKIQTRFCLGYNGPRWFASVQAFGDAQTFNMKITELRNQIGNVRWAVGYRFGKWRPYESKPRR